MIKSTNFKINIFLFFILFIFWTKMAFTQKTQGIATTLFMVNNLWLMLTAALVFIKHLGFAMLETGLTRTKMEAYPACQALTSEQ